MRKTIDDVVDSGRCVEADRVPCEKARKYLHKKGLICSAGPPRPKPTPARKSTHIFDILLSRVGNKVENMAIEKFLKEWLG